ncbi:methyltransferase [bacterium]|nr:methyltransferase [bacterium]
MNVFSFNGRDYRLERYPETRDSTLRAWDAADEYILTRCLEEGLISGNRSILIVNDEFGELGVCLAEQQPLSSGDSLLSRLALQQNLEYNGVDPGSVRFLPSTDPLKGPFDLVLMKIPKSMAFWQETLLRIRPHLAKGATVIAGGMIKHTPMTAYRLLEQIVGPTATSQGWKKARLAAASFDPGLHVHKETPESRYELEGLGVQLKSLPNVFAYSRMDPGTRMLLENLPLREHSFQAADLGCGNGALAIALALRCPEASILAVDESFQAVACAKENLAAAGLLKDRDIQVLAADGLSGCERESLDQVVCNPPFHQSRVIGDEIAWRMFLQSRAALKPGGELRIVGNRHLGYHTSLKRMFGSCRVVASDSRFSVLSAIKR